MNIFRAIFHALDEDRLTGQEKIYLRAAVRRSSLSTKGKDVALSILDDSVVILNDNLIKKNPDIYRIEAYAFLKTHRYRRGDE